MNTFVVLLMTTCAPGLDPMPAAESVPSAASGQTSLSGRNPDSRPRLFGRIRGFFTRRPRASAQSSANSSPAPQTGAAAPGTVSGPVLATAPMLPASVSSVPVHPVPTPSPAGMAPLQRMPVGTPLPPATAAAPF